MVFLEEYKFDDFTGGEPAFPLKNGGKIYYPGWEIPATWVLDSSGQAWIDDHFGQLPFKLTTKQKLLQEEKDSSKREALRVCLCMKQLRPAWMTQALKEGWTPPKDWVDPEKNNKTK